MPAIKTMTTAVALMSLLLRFSAAIALPHIPSSIAASTGPAQAEVVHQFPNGTWLENLAVRSNGAVLLSDLSAPQVLSVDPNGDPNALHTVAIFPRPATGVLGITELSHDIFYVATSAYNLSTSTPAPGSTQLWKLDLSAYNGCDEHSAHKKLIATVPQATVFNGLAALPGHHGDNGEGVLLAADSTLGVVWRVDAKSHAVDVAINNTATRAPAGAELALGVNGLNVFDGFLYLTNTGANAIMRIPIDKRGGATGPAQVLNTVGSSGPDDFALATDGRGAYVADALTNDVSFVPIMAGAGGVRKLANVQGPTSARLGKTNRDRDTLYVSSNGGDEGYKQAPVLVGGTLSKIELS